MRSNSTSSGTTPTSFQPMPSMGRLTQCRPPALALGMRYELRTNLTTHVNYGRALIQLPDTNSAARNSFVNLAVTLAY